MSSLPQLNTNKHTFRRKANPNWESQKLMTGNTATFRVKFTLTKLQEDVRRVELRQIAQTRKSISTVKIKNTTLRTSDPRRPGK